MEQQESAAGGASNRQMHLAVISAMALSRFISLPSLRAPGSEVAIPG
jgi:hypothetical protein